MVDSNKKMNAKQLYEILSHFGCDNKFRAVRVCVFVGHSRQLSIYSNTLWFFANTQAQSISTHTGNLYPENIRFQNTLMWSDSIRNFGFMIEPGLHGMTKMIDGINRGLKVDKPNFVH